MNNYSNPFEYDAANNLAEDLILDWYIEDHNYSRFLQSTRNLVLVGQRGCGKTMALLYNSFRIQYGKARKQGKPVSYAQIGVYVPCNTPLIHKQEYLLLDDYQASVISEFYLVLALLHGISEALRVDPELLAPLDHQRLRCEMEALLLTTLPEGVDFPNSLARFVHVQLRDSQKELNRLDFDGFFEKAFSFSSAILPIINALRTVSKLTSTHFIFMLDDVQDLNTFQRKIVNTWMSYRDHSRFSFKAASAKIGDEYYITSNGGSILQGHDFILIDMEEPYQNEHSDFGKLATRIVAQRLSRVDIAVHPEEFFPMSEEMARDLKECEEAVRLKAQELFPEGSRQIRDYVYKYARVEYFRKRPAQANRPPYSGFETIVQLSTGVVRNFLEPCYFMYDEVYSQQPNGSDNRTVNCVPSATQTKVILELSERLWERMENELDRTVENCSREQAVSVYRLFDNLAVLFRERLLRHHSEPRALAFSITGRDPAMEKRLQPLLDIARRAQLLYVRNGSAKEGGRRERYYVPNRMLWPVRGLDPVGQHARVSLKARDLWAAAKGKPFKYVESDITEQEELQLESV